MITDEHLNGITSDVVERLQKEKRHANYVSLLFILLFVASVCFGVSTAFKNSEQKEQIRVLTEQVKQDEEILTIEYSVGYWFMNTPDEVTDSTLYALLKENGAWYPDILVKQAKLESGNYKSVVYKNSNNLYGMKKVGRRNTTQVGVYSGYGTYNNWCLSVLDRLLWDEFRFKGVKPTREEYMKAMDIYAEADSYQKLIDRVKLNIELYDE